MSVLDKIFGKGNVTYHIAVAEAFDSVAAAIFAEQIAFWQDRSEDGWVFRSTEQIQEYTGLKRVAQEGARKVLKRAGVLEVERRGMPARLYYRMDLQKLEDIIVETNELVCRNLQTSVEEPTDRSIEGVKSEEESNPERAADAAVKPANHYTTLTVQRCLEVDFEATKRQKDTWGQGFESFVYVEEGKDPPSVEEVMRVVNKIVSAASDGYFWSVQKAKDKLKDNAAANGNRNHRGKREKKPAVVGTPDEAKGRVPMKERDYSWLFE